jgi:ankyrin repeat protein
VGGLGPGPHGPPLNPALPCTSALYSACERGYVEIAELLIQHGASLNRRPIPLMAASRNGHEACVRLLLGHNASVHSTNVKGLSAMDVACENLRFSIVELLLDHGASLPDSCDFISFLIHAT